ncbi:PREDICTED: uncharacterized protein LOC105451233 isoform X2 [Wasmannia auropunctata]|nr:PREDICTED: uncharacterized protein LOC105451233 isoform X2 [Wasmannia auropunctata]XP_011689870.1 PREDICTED: uncharacterized protein LOC105451233 isoform X2 [Wasmannia auropunctata]
MLTNLLTLNNGVIANLVKTKSASKIWDAQLRVMELTLRTNNLAVTSQVRGTADLIQQAGPSGIGCCIRYLHEVFLFVILIAMDVIQRKTQAVDKKHVSFGDDSV